MKKITMKELNKKGQNPPSRVEREDRVTILKDSLIDR